MEMPPYPVCCQRDFRRPGHAEPEQIQNEKRSDMTIRFDGFKKWTFVAFLFLPNSVTNFNLSLTIPIKTSSRLTIHSFPVQGNRFEIYQNVLCYKLF